MEQKEFGGKTSTRTASYRIRRHGMKLLPPIWRRPKVSMTCQRITGKS
jgi:hypothetical protein